MAKKDEKEEKDTFKKFQKAMSEKIRAIQKGLDVKSLNLDPHVGTNGALSTGSVVVDLNIGGGFPAKRMSTIAGATGTAKTTMVLKSLGLALKRGIFCHHEDLEGSADPEWALRNGLEADKYLGKKKGTLKLLEYIRDFDSGDDAFRYIQRIQDAAIDLGASVFPEIANAFFQDSIPACVPEAYLDNDEAGMSPRLAIMLSQTGLPPVRMKLNKSNSVYVAINQIKLNPRVQFGGSPEYEPGGSAVGYYADVKLRFHRSGNPKRVDGSDGRHGISPKESEKGLYKEGNISIENNPDGSEDRYFYVHVKSTKNRVFPPQKQTYFRVWTEHNGSAGGGIDPVWDVLRFFEEIGRLQFPDKSEVIFDGKPFTYWDLKKEILSSNALLEECYELMKTGKAFELYFNRIGGGAPDEGLSPEEGDEPSPPMAKITEAQNASNA